MQMFDPRRDPDAARRAMVRLGVRVFTQMQERESETVKAIETLVDEMKPEPEAAT